MKITGVSNLESAQRFVQHLYPNKDRDFSYIYAYAGRHYGYLGKSLRIRSDPTPQFMKAFSWTLSLANKIEIDVQSAIIRRYPEVCPYCISRTCICVKTGKKPSKATPSYRIPEELLYLSERLTNASDQKMQTIADRLSAIYPRNEVVWELIGPWMHTAKMFEELGEIHEAASRYFSKRKQKEAVAEEFSDLLAWLFGSWSLAKPGCSFDEAFIEYYINGCPVCGKSKNCSCPPFGDVSSELVDFERIEEIREAFDKIVALAGGVNDEVREIQKSLDQAAKTQSEPVARSAIKEATKKVVEIEALLDSGAKAAGSGAAIVGTFYKLLESLGFMSGSS